MYELASTMSKRKHKELFCENPLLLQCLLYFIAIQVIVGYIYPEPEVVSEDETCRPGLTGKSSVCKWQATTSGCSWTTCHLTGVQRECLRGGGRGVGDGDSALF